MGKSNYRKGKRMLSEIIGGKTKILRDFEGLSEKNKKRKKGRDGGGPLPETEF